MNPKVKKLIGLIATTGLACLGAGISGSTHSGFFTKIMGGVLSGIAGNLASQHFSFFSYERLKEWIITQHPDDLNHDVQKAFKKAIIVALGNIQFLYLENRADNQERKKIKAYFKTLKQEIIRYFPPHSPDNITESEIKSFLYDDPAIAFEQLKERFDLDLGNHSEISEFIHLNFIPQIQLSFAEELKKGEHPRTWRAFQKLLLEEIRTDIKRIVSTQENRTTQINDDQNIAPVNFPKMTKRQLRALKNLAQELNQPLKFEERFELAFDELINELKGEIQLIVQTTKDTNQKVGNIERSVSDNTRRLFRIERSLKESWLSKKMVLSYGLSVLLIMAFLITIFYYRNQPFDLTVALKPTDCQKHLPLPEIAQITLMLDDFISEPQPVNDEKRTTFKSLQSKYLNATASFTIEAEGEPYQIVEKEDYVLSADGVIQLEIELLNVNKIEGMIKRGNTPVEGVEVIVQNLVDYTNESGLFSIDVPCPKQKKVQNFMLVKDGETIEFPHEVQSGKLIEKQFYYD